MPETLRGKGLVPVEIYSDWLNADDERGDGGDEEFLFILCLISF